MNSKILKIWYIIAGSFASLAILYYIVRLFYDLFSDTVISGTFERLNIVAIIFLLLALVMMLVAIPLSNIIEKNKIKSENQKNNDEQLLTKYKSKKKN